MGKTPGATKILEARLLGGGSICGLEAQEQLGLCQLPGAIRSVSLRGIRVDKEKCKDIHGCGSWRYFIAGRSNTTADTTYEPTMFDQTEILNPGGYVYFMQVDGHPDRIKIGYTSGPLEVRRKAGITFCPTKIRIIATMPAHGQELETHLHRQFSHLRAHDAEGKDWFCLTEELQVFISKKAQLHEPIRSTRA